MNAFPSFPVVGRDSWKPGLVLAFLLALFPLTTALSGGWDYPAAVPPGSLTPSNLKTAIAFERTTSKENAAYAKRAREEGYQHIALLFEAAHESEKIHAGNHRAVLAELGDSLPKNAVNVEARGTKENLQRAIQSELDGSKHVYPPFIRAAQGEKISIAVISFRYAKKTHQKLRVLFERSLTALETGMASSLPGKYMVCMSCGNVYDGDAPARCGISMTPREHFMTIE